ncbi:MAG: type II toxin-antitoxin system HicB family antitoxin [Oscillospiraceae bacterium]|nr:type II toxin-antitoxin system HicB family antitoxin [Oscillospiraceae bacterium]
MTAKLSVICKKQSNDSYFAMCPELQGCYTQGDTYEEAIENLKELVTFFIKENLSELLKDEIFSDNTGIYSNMTVEV